MWVNFVICCKWFVGWWYVCGNWILNWNWKFMILGIWRCVCDCGWKICWLNFCSLVLCLGFGVEWLLLLIICL